jgi:DNA polymerase-1
VKCIAKAREINKAHTTFIDTILLNIVKKVGFMRKLTNFDRKVVGTVTGRFSMNNPNLQQIPARNKELGPRIRSLFIPEKKGKWGCFDYNQQEPRLVTHYASLQNLYGVDEVVDAYKNEDADFHKIVADMADIPRLKQKQLT